MSSDFLSASVPENLPQALREEGRGTKTTRRLLNGGVVLIAVLGIIMDTTLSPTTSQDIDTDRIEQVVQSLETGLQIADPHVREQIVSNSFCSGIPGSGAAAILANLPVLPLSATNHEGRIPWIKVKLKDLTVSGITAEGTLISHYYPDQLPHAELPTKPGKVTVGFRLHGEHWCIV